MRRGFCAAAMTHPFQNLKRQSRLLVSEMLNAVRVGMRDPVGGDLRPAELLQLEQRLLMSATPIAAAAELAAQANSVGTALTVEQLPESPTAVEEQFADAGDRSISSQSDVAHIAEQQVSTVAVDEPHFGTDQFQAASDQSLELVVIDRAADNWQQLINDLEQQTAGGGRHFEVLVLNPQEDGIAQVTERLQSLSEISAVHLVSHGEDGEILLGAGVLSHRTVDRYAADFLAWRDSLTADADLLIYGCDLAASDAGLALTEALDALLAADVAASDDLTGHELAGGDWQLEVTTGAIQHDVAFSEALREQWLYTLGTASFQQGIDGFSGTIDAEIRSDEPTIDHSVDVGLRVDGDLTGQALIRFENLFGNGPGQIPTGATINTAELQVDVVNPSEAGAVVSFHRMLQAWNDTATWSSMGSGVQLNDVEAVSSADATVANPGGSGLQSITGLASTVQAWLDGTADNHGWVVNNTHINGWRIRSSEYTTTSLRPRLVVSWTKGAAIAQTSEFLVNQTTTGSQTTGLGLRGSHHAVAMAKDGSYVTAWTSHLQDGDGWGVFARRFSATGVALTGELQVAETVTGDQIWASVASDSTGNFVVSWSGHGEQSGHVDNSGVYVRRFDANGTASTGEFQVNTVTAGGQHKASIDMTPAGDFVVVWEGNGPGDSDGVFFRRFHADGSAKDLTELLVNTDLSSAAVDSSIAIADSGQFTVTWIQNNNVLFRRFADTGVALDVSPQQLDSSSAMSSEPAISADSSGNFTIAFRSENFDQGIWFRRYAADGSAIGSFVEPSPPGSTDHDSASVATDRDGNFIVAYHGSTDGDGSGVFIRKYDSSGNVVGSEQLVNQSTTGVQQQASLAMTSLNNFVVVWSGVGDRVGQVDSDGGIFARQFGTGIVNTPPAADAGGPYVLAEGGTLSLNASGSSDADGDSLTYAWDLDNDGAYDDATGITPTLAWSTLPAAMRDDGVYTVGLRVSDGKGGSAVASTSLTITNVAPTLNVSGSTDATAGSSYTLSFSATDPGSDSISSWRIDWGDGTIQRIAGNPGSANHTFSQGGRTANIVVSATDEDGTWSGSDVFVAADHVTPVYRFDGTTGAFDDAVGNGAALSLPTDMVIGPDGLLYVAGFGSSNVQRFNPSTNALVDTFVSAGSGGLNQASGLAFGADGNLYVGDHANDRVLKYNGTTGAFIREFVTAASGGLNGPASLRFGADGHLYVSSSLTDNILRYNGTTGAFLDEFVAAGSGGTAAVDAPAGFSFGPDGHLYVAGSESHNVVRYDGTTGAFWDEFVTAGSGGLNLAFQPAFAPNGNLIVSSINSDNLLQFNAGTGAYVGEFVAAGANGLNAPRGIVFTPTVQVAVKESASTRARDDVYSTDASTAINVSASGVLSNDQSAPPVTSGQTLSSHAASDSDGDSIWYGGGPASHHWDFTGSGAAYTTSPTSSNPVVSAAWVLDGSGGAFAPDFESLSGDPTDAPASFELWFNPSDAIGQEIIFETGGNGQGASVSLNGSMLEFMVNDGGNTALATYDAAAEISADEFIHVVGIIDLNSPVPDVYLYVNGVLRDSVMDVTGLTHWANVDGSGLGTVNGTTNTTNTSNFEGEIAVFQMYEASLNATQVQNNFDAVDQAVGPTSLTAGGLNTTSTTGLVTLNADGSFSYDPNGNFTHLGQGQTFNDTFHYQASDGSTNDSATVTIAVSGVNDLPTVNGGQSFVVAETAANGTTVGTVAASDPDTGTTFSSWTITGGNSDGVFGINSATGQLSVVDSASLNFETTSSYSLTVTVSDGLATSVGQSVTIFVSDQNDQAPAITPGQTFSISETATNGAAVGNVSATDGDAGTTFSGWTIVGGNVDGIFGIDASSGQITVADRTALDFETTSSYTLSLTVTDGANTSAVRTVPVNVTDHNDEAPVIDLGQTFSISETASNGAVVGNVSATDGDAGATFSGWSIVGGNVHGIFGIEASTGQITVTDRTKLDHDVTATYLLSITVSDGSATSASESVTVRVTTGNLNPPVIDSGLSFSVSEAAADGASVGTVTAADPDSGSTLSNWTIVGGNADGVFSLNATTGQLTVVDRTSLNFETTDRYTLLLQVSDGVHTSAVESIAVSVVDVNEPPEISAIADLIANEDERLGPIPFLIRDPESSAHTLDVSVTTSHPSLINIADIVVGGTGTNRFIQIQPVEDAYGGPVVVSVTVSDGVLSTSNSFQITLNSVNDAPELAGRDPLVLPLTGETYKSAAPGLLQHATDVDGDALKVVILTAPTHGSLTVGPDGAFMFELDDDLPVGIRSDSFRYVVSDGLETSNVRKVVLTMPVRPVAAPPVLPAPAPEPPTVTEVVTDSVADVEIEIEAESDTAKTEIIAAPIESSEKDDDAEESFVPPPVRSVDESTSEFTFAEAPKVEAYAFTFQQEVNVSVADADRVTVTELYQDVHTEAASEQIRSVTLAEGQRVSPSAYTFARFAELQGTADQAAAFEEQMESDFALSGITANSIAFAGTSIVIGSVITAVRGGMLAFGLLSQLPIWTIFDPMMVMDGVNGDDGESLEEIVDREARRSESRDAFPDPD